jgi:hypothetical protein
MMNIQTKKPLSRRATEQRDELAPFHPIKLHVVTTGPEQDCRIAT